MPAVSNAIGVYLTDFPITPDKVLEALRNKEAEAIGETAETVEEGLEIPVPVA